MTQSLKHVVLLKSRAANFGGLEKSANRIASAFVGRGAKVSILTTGKAPENSEPISFYSTKTLSWPAFLRMEQFDRFTRSWLEKNPADLIFGMDRNRNQTHIRAGNGVHDAYLKSREWTEGKWKMISCRFNPLHQKILELEKYAFENPRLQKLFTNSYMVRSQILERYKTDPAKIKVIHNGVEWHEMQQDFHAWHLQKEVLLKKWDLPKDVCHFLFIGHGYLRKGLSQLLLGLSRIKAKNFHLSIVGKEGKIEEYIKKTDELGLSKHVRFFGPQGDMRPFYQLADVLVIPSFYDPFANVTIEALAMGLFVLSSRYNGGHEILSPENGLILEDLLDPDAMAASLTQAIQHPKTKESAQKIRDSVRHLDFSLQLNLLMEACLG